VKVVIIKYNAGNIMSVYYALQRLGVEAEITGNKETIRTADRVIFPGVGEASTAMQYLRHEGLDEVIRRLTQPVLGICIGLQLLCTHSEEGNVDCIGIFPNRVRRFQPLMKVPHMGWNAITQTQTPLLRSCEGEYVYFVHSYYAEKNEYTIAVTDYIEPFSAALHKDNFYATQFHPEKSGPVGRKILENSLKL